MDPICSWKSSGPRNVGIGLIRILQLFCDLCPSWPLEQAKGGKARTDKPHTSFTKGQWHFEMQKIAARFNYDPSDTVAYHEGHRISAFAQLPTALVHWRSETWSHHFAHRNWHWIDGCLPSLDLFEVLSGLSAAQSASRNGTLESAWSNGQFPTSSARRTV